MSPQEQQRVISEATGLPSVQQVCRQIGPGRDAWHTQAEGYDFLNDLNAMHEAEKLLKAKGSSCYYTSYQQNLLLASKSHCNSLQGPIARQHILHATAPQRAEALLRTLELWTE